jgi:hypothetical protein
MPSSGTWLLHSIGAGLLSIAVCWLLWYPREFFLRLRCRRIFRKWLEQNGFEVVSREWPGFWKNPFLWKPSIGERVVSRLELRDSAGKVRKGFVRCGDHAKGFLGRHDLEVLWDSPPDERGLSTARLLLWLVLPFISLGTFVAAYAFCFSGPEFAHSYLGPLVIAGYVALGIGVMLVERRRGYPTLRRILAVDASEFRGLILSNGLACLGALLMAAVVFRFGLGQLGTPTVAEAAGWLGLFSGGCLLLILGLRRLKSRL